ncbi:hypothetical protein OGY35_03115, partial [Citrobacter sp. Ct235]|uniref:hypothetical protein n=1 Tax=Citrobacter sp. Ct235 TaxID=2985157 RepID=UPI00257620F7
SEVKRRSADGSVGSPHARVGNCQASNKQENLMRKHGVFLFYPQFSEEAILRMAFLRLYLLLTLSNLLRLLLNSFPAN